MLRVVGQKRLWQTLQLHLLHTQIDTHAEYKSWSMNVTKQMCLSGMYRM
jgi:hypothetical protein